MSDHDSTELLERLARLEDQAQICRTLYAYGSALDYGDRDQFLRCFTDDADYVVTMRTTGETAMHFRGHDQLGGYFDGHTHAPAAWHKRLLARLQHHGGHPANHGRHAVNQRAFKQRIERRTQHREQIREVHARQVVGHDENSPAQNSRSEKLHRPVKETADRNQHEDHKQTAERHVALERVLFEHRHAVRGN